MSMAMPLFVPPGPGLWELEATHFPRPLPRFALEGIIRGFKTGFAEGSRRYGLPLAYFDVKIVNGFWYQRAVPAGGNALPGLLPPRPVLWLATRLHPEIRRRARSASEAFALKLWRTDLERWDHVDKPLAQRAHRALLDVEISSLDDAGLLDHLGACEVHLEAMVALHHRYTMACFAPLGDLLVHVTEWTGCDCRDVVQLLRGSSPISLGFSASELSDIAALIRADERALTVSTTDERKALVRLAAWPGELGRAIRGLVDTMRYRALSYDLGDPLVGEMPEILSRALRATVLNDTPVTSGAGQHEQELRRAVPVSERRLFDELLAEARIVNRLRDERGMYAECWAVGIARRALLELGNRLVQRERLVDPAHAVDATLPELRALANGRAGPGAEELEARARFRMTASVADCPVYLGGEAPPRFDVTILRERARRMAKATIAAVENTFRNGEPEREANKVRGLGVNAGVYEGIARRIEVAAEFARLRQGDVLVTRNAAPFFNAILPMLGAIVTDRGGQLCHAAIVAREYGIPGIVGTNNATEVIPDGACVRVDGANGEVTIFRS